jgi:lysophospholipase L1-like esterase
MSTGASTKTTAAHPAAHGDDRPRGLGRGLRLTALALPAAALLLLFALAEIVLRLGSSPVESLDVFVRAPLVLNDFTDGNHVRIFEGDALLLWRLKPNLRRVVWDFTPVSTSAAHLRADGPLGAKPKGAVRIVCLGDSVTFGYRVPLVFPTAPDSYNRSEGPYPVLLERQLRAANRGRAVEVVNMAVPGYSSRQALAWLRRDIVRLAPDVVTICLGWNDVSPREAPDRTAILLDAPHVFARQVVGSSQLLMRATLAFRRWRTKGLTSASLGARATEAEFVANVIAAAELARSHGAEVVVIAPIFGGTPSPTAEMGLVTAYRAALKRESARRGLAFLEVRDLTEAAFPENAYYFPTEAIHPGAEGHRLLARALLRLLEERQVLHALSLAAPPPEAQAP